MRRGVIVGLTMLVLVAGADAGEPAPSWPLPRLMAAIDGKRVIAAGRSIRIETESTLCGGEGRSVRSGGVRRWSRFACTYTTFGARGIERDLEFHVRVVGPRRIAVTAARWIVGP
jgi:hypothetical protein